MQASESSEKPDRARATGPARVDHLPVLPDRPVEDSDAAWGDPPDDLEDWLLRERPPHHGD